MDAEVAIVGVGAAGSQLAWQLAARDLKVVALERFQPGHDRGSSHGETRIIRSAYFEGAGYVPLVRRAFARWRRLEAETGEEILRPTGALMIGPAGGELVQGALHSARENGLDHQVLDARELGRLYPQHRLFAGEVAVLEAEAGFLRPEKAVRAAAAAAVAAGAEIRDQTQVEAVEASPGRVLLHTSRGDLSARRVVIAAGAWTPKLVPELQLPLSVERQVMFWFRTREPELFAADRFPVFLRELPGGRFRYGTPTDDPSAVKVAVHHEGGAADPDQLERQVRRADREPVLDFVAGCLAGVSQEVVRERVCMYTNAPGERFLILSPPGLPGVTVVSACSGHGFKFAPAVAEAVADLLLHGRQPPAIIGTSWSEAARA